MIKKCEFCNKEFDAKKKYNKYCSDICNRTAVGLKNKGKIRTSETKKRMSEAKKGTPLSEEHKLKISNSCKGKKLTEETKRKMSLSRMGDKNVSKRKNVREKLSKAAKRNIKNRTSNIFCMNKKDTVIEYIFENMLKIRNICYIKQYQIETKFYDFYLPFFNTLVEIDGDYWHANPIFYKDNLFEAQKRNMLNDEIKNKLAKNKGFKLTRVWGSELKESSETRKMSNSSNKSFHERPTFLELIYRNDDIVRT